MSMRVLGTWDSTRPRISARAPLLDTRNVNHGLLLPILMHCEDDQGRPLLGPTSQARQTEQVLRNAHSDIPAANTGHASVLDADPLPPRRLTTA